MRDMNFRPMRHATRWGLAAGGIAALLWPIHSLVQEPARPWFMLALAIAALCGVAMLALTALDLATVRRSRSVLPARMFDLALGLALTVPTTAALAELWR